MDTHSIFNSLREKKNQILSEKQNTSHFYDEKEDDSDDIQQVLMKKLNMIKKEDT